MPRSKKENQPDSVEAELERNKKAGGGFQKGNKLASKSVKDSANIKKGVDKEILNNPKSTVAEVLGQMNLNAANEMVKAARRIKNPLDKFKAFRDITEFVEGKRKSVDIKLNKTEEKFINITYKPMASIEDTPKRKPLMKVVEAEYKKLKKEIDNEISEEIQDEIISKNKSKSRSDESK